MEPAKMEPRQAPTKEPAKMEPRQAPRATKEPAKMELTVWPSSLPTRDDQHILSMAVGNSHLHWAFHKDISSENNLSPTLFWRTPHLTDEDIIPKNSTVTLSRHLPKYAHDYIFGLNVRGSVEAALEQSKKRKNAQIKIYVISTNSSQFKRLAFLWAGIPCKLFIMKGDDFFTKDQGTYQTIGIDRLATLRGAADIHGYPALVFDGGTATTYTAVDESGRIMGGGIGPGLALKLRSLGEYTDLPNIHVSEVLRRAKEAMVQNKPIATFAMNTRDAIVARVLREFADAGRSVIGDWIDKVGSAKTAVKMENGAHSSSHNFNRNKERVVLLTGGDGEVCSQLFQTDFGGILEGFSSISIDGFEVRLAKHLLHYGVSSALLGKLRQWQRQSDKDSLMADTNSSAVMSKYLGKRVAKLFDDEYYCGSIDGVYKGSAEGAETVLFHIAFDDGDGEDVEIEELDDLFRNLERMKNETKPRPNQKHAAKATKGAKRGSSNIRKPPKPTMPVPKAKRPKMDIAKNPQHYVGSRVAKMFGREVFFGTINAVDVDDNGQCLWTVAYDDGDREDFDNRDLSNAQNLYEQRKDQDTAKKAAIVDTPATAAAAAVGSTGTCTGEGDIATGQKKSSED